MHIKKSGTGDKSSGGLVRILPLPATPLHSALFPTGQIINEGEVNMATIQELRKDIVEALEKGEPTAPLEKELQAERLRAQTDSEVAALKGIADHRAELRARAATIEAKVARQNEAVARFLEARSEVVKALLEAKAQVKGLQSLQDACFVEYPPGAFNFRKATQDIPEGYLVSDMVQGELVYDYKEARVSGVELVASALYYLEKAIDVLAGASKLEHNLPHLLKEHDALES